MASSSAADLFIAPARPWPELRIWFAKCSDRNGVIIHPPLVVGMGATGKTCCTQLRLLHCRSFDQKQSRKRGEKKENRGQLCQQPIGTSFYSGARPVRQQVEGGEPFLFCCVTSFNFHQRTLTLAIRSSNSIGSLFDTQGSSWSVRAAEPRRRRPLNYRPTKIFLFSLSAFRNILRLLRYSFCGITMEEFLRIPLKMAVLVLLVISFLSLDPTEAFPTAATEEPLELSTSSALTSKQLLLFIVHGVNNCTRMPNEQGKVTFVVHVVKFSLEKAKRWGRALGTQPLLT